MRSVALFVLFVGANAAGAAPRSQAAPNLGVGDESPPEQHVRKSFVVESDGKIVPQNSQEKSEEKVLHSKPEPTPELANSAIRVEPNVHVADAAPEVVQRALGIHLQTKEEPVVEIPQADATEKKVSSSQTMMAVASFILLILAVYGIFFRPKSMPGDEAAGGTLGGTEQVSLKVSKQDSKAPSSTSETSSGERIKVLFDRVRQSLEDLNTSEAGATLPPQPPAPRTIAVQD